METDIIPEAREMWLTELIMLKQKFGFDHIWFCDDIFGLKPGWVKEFADLVEKEGIEV